MLGNRLISDDTGFDSSGQDLLEFSTGGGWTHPWIKRSDPARDSSNLSATDLPASYNGSTTAL